MLDVLRHAWANPSSMHGPGQAARRAGGRAGPRGARAWAAMPAELVFTSGATEANHMAVLGTLATLAQATGRRRAGCCRPSSIRG